jgi:curved DNA-binding protein CbpA
MVLGYPFGFQMNQEEVQPVQLWVRNEKAQVFGPLTAASVELLLDNGVIVGRVQVSIDGNNYVYPGRMPGVRVFFPRELWGDVVVPGDELDKEWSLVVPPPAIPGDLPTRPGGAPPGPPVGGGAAPRGPPPGNPRAPMAGPVMAGPGVRTQVAQRPMNPNPQQVKRPVQPPPRAVGPVGAPVAMTTDALFGDLEGAPSVPAGPAAARPVAPPFAGTPSGVRAVPAPAAPAAPPMSSPSGVRAAPPMSSPSAVRAAPPMASPSGVRAAPPVSSSSGLRAAPPMQPAGELPTTGTLDELSVMKLYGLCAAKDANVLVTLHLSDRSLQLHFKKGSPEFLDSTHSDDSLQSFLMAQGLATPQQLGLAEAQKAKFGGELLPALFGLGLINPGIAFQQLSERATSILYRALTAEEGTFAVQHLELSPARSMPLGNKWALYLEQLRRAPIADVRRRMHEAMDYPVMRSGGPVDASDLKLLPQEVRALTFFDGVRTLTQLVRDFPNEADTLVRTAWLLRALDLVAFGANAVVDPRSAAPVGGPAAPGVAPVQPAAPSIAPSHPSAVRVAPAPPPVVAPPPQVIAPAPVAAPPPPVVAPPPAAVRAPMPGPPPGAPQQKTTVPYPGAKPPGAPVPPGPPPAVARPAAAPVAGPPARPMVTAPTMATPIPPRPVAPATKTPAPPSDDAVQLQATLEKMKGQNFFDLFGLKKDADAGAVKIAYFKLAKSYHPDTVPAGTPEGIANAKADIFALIGEANRTLSDANLKAHYLAELEAGGTGEKVDIATLLQAEECFQKGCILVKARKYAEAVKMLDDAIKANADEGEYFGWRGWAKYFSNEDKSKAYIEAMKDIELSLKMNPAAAAVHYFLGFLLKAKGDLARAKASFKKCADLDPRHIDAQRELRTTK